MTTVFLDAVFKPFFFFNRPWHGPTTDDRSDEFPDGWLPSNHSTYGVCECKHAISNTSKEKNHALKDRESEGATARLRNGKWGALETCFKQWSLTRLQCALWHHIVETTHWHSLFFFGAVLSTTHSKDVRFPWVTLYKIQQNFSSQIWGSLFCQWHGRGVLEHDAVHSYINNCLKRCNTKQSIYYSAISLYMFRVPTTPNIRSTQNCNYSLWYWSYICVATSFYRGHDRRR